MEYKDEFSANIVEGYKAPRCVRYLFLVKTKKERKPKTVMTLRSLDNAIRANYSELDYIKVVDLREDTVRDMILNLAFSFLDSWRENYFYDDWFIPFQYFY